MLVILLDWSVDLWERRLLIYRHCRRILRRDRRGKKCVFGMNLCLSENFFTAIFFVNRILVLIMIVIFLFNCIIINLTKCFQQAAPFQLGPQLVRWDQIWHSGILWFLLPMFKTLKNKGDWPQKKNISFSRRAAVGPTLPSGSVQVRKNFWSFWRKNFFGQLILRARKKNFLKKAEKTFPILESFLESW